MKVSTRGEYAVTAMLYLARKYGEDGFTSLNDIATDNNISLKYLEKIINNLKKNDFFITERGNAGGYKLKRRPEEYTLYEIILNSEGRISPVSCLDGEKKCTNGRCMSYKFWQDLDKNQTEFLKSKTLKDYM